MLSLIDQDGDSLITLDEIQMKTFDFGIEKYDLQPNRLLTSTKGNGDKFWKNEDPKVAISIRDLGSKFLAARRR